MRSHMKALCLLALIASVVCSPTDFSKHWGSLLPKRDSNPNRNPPPREAPLEQVSQGAPRQLTDELPPNTPVTYALQYAGQRFSIQQARNEDAVRLTITSPGPILVEVTSYYTSETLFAEEGTFANKTFFFSGPCASNGHAYSVLLAPLGPQNVTVVWAPASNRVYVDQTGTNFATRGTFFVHAFDLTAPCSNVTAIVSSGDGDLSDVAIVQQCPQRFGDVSLAAEAGSSLNLFGTLNLTCFSSIFESSDPSPSYAPGSGFGNTLLQAEGRCLRPGSYFVVIVPRGWSVWHYSQEAVYTVTLTSGLQSASCPKCVNGVCIRGVCNCHKPYIGADCSLVDSNSAVLLPQGDTTTVITNSLYSYYYFNIPATQGRNLVTSATIVPDGQQSAGALLTFAKAEGRERVYPNSLESKQSGFYFESCPEESQGSFVYTIRRRIDDNVQNVTIRISVALVDRAIPAGSSLHSVSPNGRSLLKLPASAVQSTITVLDLSQTKSSISDIGILSCGNSTDYTRDVGRSGVFQACREGKQGKTDFVLVEGVPGTNFSVNYAVGTPTCNPQCNMGYCNGDGSCVCFRGFSGPSCSVNNLYTQIAPDTQVDAFFPDSDSVFYFYVDFTTSGNFLMFEQLNSINSFFSIGRSPQLTSDFNTYDNFWSSCEETPTAGRWYGRVRAYGFPNVTVSFRVSANAPTTLANSQVGSVAPLARKNWSFRMTDTTSSRLSITLSQSARVAISSLCRSDDPFGLGAFSFSDRLDAGTHEITVPGCKRDTYILSLEAGSAPLNYTISFTSNPANTCPSCCSKRGFCNETALSCQCLPGWTGPDCSTPSCISGINIPLCGTANFVPGSFAIFLATYASKTCTTQEIYGHISSFVEELLLLTDVTSPSCLPTLKALACSVYFPRCTPTVVTIACPDTACAEIASSCQTSSPCGTPDNICNLETFIDTGYPGVRCSNSTLSSGAISGSTAIAGTTDISAAESCALAVVLSLVALAVTLLL